MKSPIIFLSVALLMLPILASAETFDVKVHAIDQLSYESLIGKTFEGCNGDALCDETSRLNNSVIDGLKSISIYNGSFSRIASIITNRSSPLILSEGIYIFQACVDDTEYYPIKYILMVNQDSEEFIPCLPVGNVSFGGFYRGIEERVYTFETRVKDGYLSYPMLCVEPDDTIANISVSGIYASGMVDELGMYCYSIFDELLKNDSVTNEIRADGYGDIRLNLVDRVKGIQNFTIVSGDGEDIGLENPHIWLNFPEPEKGGLLNRATTLLYLVVVLVMLLALLYCRYKEREEEEE
jgi:hypothetical protein